MMHPRPPRKQKWRGKRRPTVHAHVNAIRVYNNSQAVVNVKAINKQQKQKSHRNHTAWVGDADSQTRAVKHLARQQRINICPVQQRVVYSTQLCENLAHALLRPKCLIQAIVFTDIHLSDGGFGVLCGIFRSIAQYPTSVREIRIRNIGEMPRPIQQSVLTSLSKHIARFDTLQKLELSGSSEPDFLMSKLVALALSGSKRFQELCLDSNVPIPIWELREFDNPCAGHKLVDFSTLGLRNQSAMIVVHMTQHMFKHSVVHLNLRNNSLDDVAVIAIAKLIAQRSLANLEYLDLSKNSISNTGWDSLCDAIREVPGLRNLLLQGNYSIGMVKQRSRVAKTPSNKRQRNETHRMLWKYGISTGPDLWNVTPLTHGKILSVLNLTTRIAFDFGIWNGTGYWINSSNEFTRKHSRRLSIGIVNQKGTTKSTESIKLEHRTELLLKHAANGARIRRATTFHNAILNARSRQGLPGIANYIGRFHAKVIQSKKKHAAQKAIAEQQLAAILLQRNFRSFIRCGQFLRSAQHVSNILRHTRNTKTRLVRKIASITVSGIEHDPDANGKFEIGGEHLDGTLTYFKEHNKTTMYVLERLQKLRYKKMLKVWAIEKLTGVKQNHMKLIAVNTMDRTSLIPPAQNWDKCTLDTDSHNETSSIAFPSSRIKIEYQFENVGRATESKPAAIRVVSNIMASKTAVVVSDAGTQWVNGTYHVDEIMNDMDHEKQFIAFILDKGNRPTHTQDLISTESSEADIVVSSESSQADVVASSESSKADVVASSESSKADVVASSESSKADVVASSESSKADIVASAESSQADKLVPTTSGSNVSNEVPNPVSKPNYAICTPGADANKPNDEKTYQNSPVKQPSGELGTLSRADAPCILNIKQGDNTMWVLSQNKLWVNGDKFKPQELVYYSMHVGESDQYPPTTGWKCGPLGTEPPPLIIPQGSKAHKVTTLQEATTDHSIQHRRPSLVARKAKDSYHKACAMIQSSFRRGMFVHFTRTRVALKEIEDIQSVRVYGCEQAEALGIYTFSTLDFSSNNTVSATYIKTVSNDGEQVSSEDVHVLRRTQQSGMSPRWIITRIESNDNAIVLFANVRNGWSLKPPLRYWQSCATPSVTPFATSHNSRTEDQGNNQRGTAPKLEWNPNEHEHNEHRKHTACKVKRETSGYCILDAGVDYVNGLYRQVAGQGNRSERGLTSVYRMENSTGTFSLRQVEYGKASIWILLGEMAAELDNHVYYVNSVHGKSLKPPSEGWILGQHGSLPVPLCVYQRKV